MRHSVTGGKHGILLQLMVLLPEVFFLAGSLAVTFVHNSRDDTTLCMPAARLSAA
jgi:hypothetical protein